MAPGALPQSLEEGTQPAPVSCLENPHGRRSLVGRGPWGHTGSDTTEAVQHAHSPRI